MDILAPTYYRDNKYYKKIVAVSAYAKFFRPYMSMRMVVILLSLLTYNVTANARTEYNDTTTTAAQTHTHIDFRVNLTDLDSSYHGIGLQLDCALAKIDSMILNTDMRVKRITIVGTASPEGPYANNRRLATGRAKALASILKTRYPFPDSIYHVSTIPEDWEGMKKMLEKNHSIPYSGIVLDFLAETENIAPDIRERQIKHLGEGKPYASMRDNVLPYLRRSSVIVDYDNRLVNANLQSVAIPRPEIECIAPSPHISTSEIQFLKTGAPRKRFYAVKTNLLWDVAMCANLGVEIELWPHWSLDIPVWYSPYDITSRWRIRLLATQPEVRYWPKDAGKGHYFGVHASVAGFNVSTGGDYRYQDPNHAAFGLGLGYGYAFHLDKEHRWGMEAQIGAGYISYRWVKYHNTGRNGAKISRGSGTYWGVTRAGVAISYKFYQERKERRWMKW